VLSPPFVIPGNALCSGLTVKEDIGLVEEVGKKKITVIGHVFLCRLCDMR